MSRIFSVRIILCILVIYISDIPDIPQETRVINQHF
jgi:hypothetical protein